MAQGVNAPMRIGAGAGCDQDHDSDLQADPRRGAYGERCLLPDSRRVKLSIELTASGPFDGGSGSSLKDPRGKTFVVFVTNGRRR